MQAPYKVRLDSAISNVREYENLITTRLAPYLYERFHALYADAQNFMKRPETPKCPEKTIQHYYRIMLYEVHRWDEMEHQVNRDVKPLSSECSQLEGRFTWIRPFMIQYIVSRMAILVSTRNGVSSASTPIEVKTDTIDQFVFQLFCNAADLIACDEDIYKPFGWESRKYHITTQMREAVRMALDALIPAELIAKFYLNNNVSGLVYNYEQMSEPQPQPQTQFPVATTFMQPAFQQQQAQQTLHQLLPQQLPQQQPQQPALQPQPQQAQPQQAQPQQPQQTPRMQQQPPTQPQLQSTTTPQTQPIVAASSGAPAVRSPLKRSDLPYYGSRPEGSDASITDEIRQVMSR